MFVRKAWFETPIFYYLKPNRYRLAGRNFTQVASDHRETRVWVVFLYDNQQPPDMQMALSDFRVVRTISLSRGNAILYERAPVAEAAVR